MSHIPLDYHWMLLGCLTLSANHSYPNAPGWSGLNKTTKWWVIFLRERKGRCNVGEDVTVGMLESLLASVQESYQPVWQSSASYFCHLPRPVSVTSCLHHPKLFNLILVANSDVFVGLLCMQQYEFWVQDYVPIVTQLHLRAQAYPHDAKQPYKCTQYNQLTQIYACTVITFG